VSQLKFKVVTSHRQAYAVTTSVSLLTVAA